MNSIETRTVRDLALEIPGATRVFEKAGIDYCCGGQRSLADACTSAGVTIEEMMNSLELARSSQPLAQEVNFQNGSLAELIDHIVAKHHVFTKTELQRLRALIDKVHGVHGENHPELAQLRSLFQNLSSELEPHMLKEEMVLFPYVVRLEAATRNQQAVSTPPFMTVANPVRMMMLEHEAAGYLLEKMRKLTNDYTTPADACFSYKTLYEALDALEKDLHHHIHLENNILFPRAVEMEAQLSY
ncbi:MAG TPA: iron-sulfur cluster repair di-iron protein [Pyrinomonadaceae bacterium]|nr:iron-sulfur cluster repair di-iron protein [Pyrinomonadaceae bacterium]